AISWHKPPAEKLHCPGRWEQATDNAIFRQAVWAMKIRYPTDTDTPLTAFRDPRVAETRDLDENRVLDLDADGNLCAITLEHASERAGAPEVTYEQATT